MIRSYVQCINKYRKPFWNLELETLYKKVALSEKELSKCTLRYKKQDLRHKLKLARSEFDKMYRREERKFKREQVVNLENFCTSNPNEFWEKLRQLGPQSKKGIPMEVYDESNTIVCDHEQVLGKWERDFEHLYNRKVIDGEDPEFEKYITDSILLAEQNMTDPLYEENQALNGAITLKEVDTAVSKANNKKSPGIDLLHNEILKNPNIRTTLKELFQLCLDSGKIPTEWYKAIIKPLPKGSDNDPRVPLNY